MLIIVQSVQDLSLMTMLIKINILIIVHIIATSILSTHKIPLLTWYFTMSHNLVFWDRRHVGNLRTQKYHARNGKWYFTMIHFLSGSCRLSCNLRCHWSYPDWYSKSWLGNY